MWSNIQTFSNMGLQMLSNSGKRPREDCLNGGDEDDGPMPAKLGKTTDDSLWDEYYPAGKCYQCNEAGSAVTAVSPTMGASAVTPQTAPQSASFYNSASAFACEQYNPASTQCWPSQLVHRGSTNNVNPAAAAAAAAAATNAASLVNQTNGSSQCGVHLSNHMCNGTAIANSSSISVTGGVATVPGSPPHPASVAPAFHGGPASPQAQAATVPSTHPQQHQQTIRCDENGKSYLDLGSGSAPTPNSNVFSSRCCNPRTKWCMCGPSCYRQRRLTVLNISMCKLGRYRQFTDPSLYRSVLICNTLRYIEREMEQEGCFANNQQTPPLIVLEPPPEPPRAPTPYPPPLSQTNLQDDNDSGIGDDNRSINWGSVLSLSSQSDLDPLNNNDSLGELDFSQDFEDIIPSCKLTHLSVDDIFKTVPPTTQPSKESPDIDNIMQVLRFTN